MPPLQLAVQGTSDLSAFWGCSAKRGRLPPFEALVAPRLALSATPVKKLSKSLEAALLG